jgi:hypothetical protein
VGEDSAVFRLGDQRVVSWAYFSGILAVVLYALNVLWIDPATGFGTSFLDAVGSISDSHEVRPDYSSLSLPMLNYSFIHSYAQQFIHSFLCSTIHSFIPILNNSIPMLNNSFIPLWCLLLSTPSV